MRRPLLLCVIAVACLSAAPLAAAGPMTLASNGDLYKAWIGDDGLMLTRSGADDTTEEWLVPGSQGVDVSHIQVLLDENTGSCYVIYQSGRELDATVKLAHLNDLGVWSEATHLSGGHGDGLGAVHPVALTHVAEHEIIEDDGTTSTLRTTFLHVAWWEKSYYAEFGVAVLTSIPLDETGHPDFAAQTSMELGDLLDYGISCSSLPNADMLTYPRLFLDLETSTPHVFVTDFATCLLPMIQLGYDIEEILDGTEKRRRHITVFRTGTMMAFPPEVPLGAAKLEVGRSLTVAFHWDVDDGVAWVLMDRNGWSDTKLLATGEDLSHEQAVTLIRKLVR
jgi:hypothetical protein